MRLLLVFLVTVLHFSQAQTAEISKAARLRKASLLLTGKAPMIQVMREAETLSDDEFEEFFGGQINWLLAQDTFPQHFKNHVLNLFRMYVTEESNDYQYGDPMNNLRNNNAFNHLVEEIFYNNKPWRDLIQSQSYEATDIIGFQGGGDLLFFQFVFYEELGPQLQNFVETQVAQGSFLMSSDFTSIPLEATTTNQQQTLAGIITTNRFFARFPTTKINKNRARAAAIFNAFLCDPMKPIVLTSDEEDQELLNKALQMEQAHSGAEISQDLEARHGSDPACMACHYKLDPMANVFAGSSLNLNPFAAPGALVFKTQAGEDFRQEVVGFKELADAIVEQDDYRSCQVQHFWDWVIGEDIPLTAAKKQELVATFVAMDEKPKDFIKHLVTSVDFARYTTLQESDIRYSHVRPIFQRCDSCHSGESMAPMLSEGYPYPEFYEAFFGRPLVEAVALETKLAQHGSGASMPPNNAGWSLRPEERDLLLAWIKNGAKDDDGVPHYQEGSLLEQLSSVEYEEGFRDILEPTFYSTFSRLLAGNMLVTALQDRFEANPSGSMGCRYDTTDRNTIGFPLATNGRPIFKFVNPNYLRWWYSCLQEKENDMRIFYQNPPENFLVDNETLIQEIHYWEDANPEQRLQLFLMVERQILGLGILPEDNRQRLLSRVNEQMANGLGHTRADAMAIIAKTLLSTRHFLTY